MGYLKRRDFLGNMGVCAAGTLGSKLIMSHPGTVQDAQILQLSKNEKNISPRDVKINVKPVSSYIIHGGVWTGPCRWNPNPPPEEEKARFRNYAAESIKTLEQHVSQDARILEPVYIEYPEATGFGEKQLVQLRADNEKVDLYLISGNVYPQYPGSLIGERYKKPVAMITNYVNWELSARLRSKGLEGYAPADHDELNDLISILRARKVFQNTNLLIISNTPLNNRPAPGACTDFKGLNDRFGFNATFIDYKEFTEERDRVMNSRDMMGEVEKLSDRLIKNAQEVRIDRKWVISSVLFYCAVKNLLTRYNCNAFTIECFEFCSSKLAYDWKVVPCLTHSLLKDEGYPSGCEGDINVSLAMDLLMGLSKKSAYMGNLYIKDRNTMYLGHNVPAMKMMGFDKPDLPYSLQNFITEGWGPKVQMDLSKFEEKTVTIARCNPLASKILVTKGTITGCEGFAEVGCSLKVLVNIPDTKGLVKKAHNYGFHFAMVYGDYTDKIYELAGMLDLEVESHNV
ncbi:MAG TPA: hypothetical protein VM123_13595 [archaeon]|nr:hypothetical protein [archaeon]